MLKWRSLWQQVTFDAFGRSEGVMRQIAGIMPIFLHITFCSRFD